MKRQVDKYRNLLDNIYDGIYFVDTERRIAYWNKGAERITGYSAKDVVGSRCSDNILVHIDETCRELCKVSCPLTETIQTGEVRIANVSLHHKLGHRVPVLVTASPIRNDEGEIIGAVEIFREALPASTDAELLEELRKAAFLDSLTGLPNRRFLEMKLRSGFEDLRRYNVPFGVLLADIDFFKKVNNTFGHRTGDDVLKMVARTFAGNIRQSDMAGRWGGEEFLVIVNYASEKHLRAVGEKLRLFVEKSFLEVDDSPLLVTVSIGGALAGTDDSIESLVARADRFLYQGKSEGRNCVRL